MTPSPPPVTASPLATPVPASAVTLRTRDAPDGACRFALAAGELVADQRTGIALKHGEGTTQIIWPHGYSGRIEGGRLALVDGAGRVRAYVGDSVEVGGGFGNDPAFIACDNIEVVVPER